MFTLCSGPGGPGAIFFYSAQFSVFYNHRLTLVFYHPTLALDHNTIMQKV